VADIFSGVAGKFSRSWGLAVGRKEAENERETTKENGRKGMRRRQREREREREREYEEETEGRIARRRVVTRRKGRGRSGRRCLCLEFITQ